MKLKRYVLNVILYVAALCGLLAFVAVFLTPLEIYDELHDTWTAYNVRALLGEIVEDKTILKGTALPVFGFIIPLLCSIFIIIESFRPEWGKKIHVMNNILVVLFFVSAVLVLLTKELFLSVNGLGFTPLIRNGGSLIFSAVCSALAGILVLFATWVPSEAKIKFIVE